MALLQFLHFVLLDHLAEHFWSPGCMFDTSTLVDCPTRVLTANQQLQNWGTLTPQLYVLLNLGVINTQPCASVFFFYFFFYDTSLTIFTVLEVGNSVEVQLSVSESSTGPCEGQHAVTLGAS